VIFSEYFKNADFNEKGQQLPTTKKLMNMQMDYNSNLPKIMENNNRNNNKYSSTSIYQQQQTNPYSSNITVGGCSGIPGNGIGDNQQHVRSGSNTNLNNRGFSQFGKSLLDNKAYPSNVNQNNNNMSSYQLGGPVHSNNQLNSTEPLLNTKNSHSHSYSVNKIQMGKNG